ncbi:MAG: regulatory protein RecX [Rhodanobacteraceae bacterium]
MNRQQGKKKSRDSAYERALALLARREHSRKDLASKLERKGFDRDEIREALQQLIEAGYQSDQRFAEMLVRSRVAHAYGPVRIRAELRSHGLDDSLVESALAEVDQDTDWAELANDLLQRHYGEQAASDYAERGKRAQFLVRRGFPAEIAHQASQLD